jgi:hypothetical protein
MNFPSGQVVKKGELPFNFQEIFNDLNSKNFNGYLILSVHSNFFEEGICFFKSGQIIGSLVEVLNLKKLIKGDEAMDYFLNATVGNGFYQIVELTKSQVDLIIAFDEKLGIKNMYKDFSKKIPSKFSEKFELNISKDDLFNKYGLDALD